MLSCSPMSGKTPGSFPAGGFRALVRKTRKAPESTDFPSAGNSSILSRHFKSYPGASVQKAPAFFGGITPYSADAARAVQNIRRPTVGTRYSSVVVPSNQSTYSFSQVTCSLWLGKLNHAACGMMMPSYVPSQVCSQTVSTLVLNTSSGTQCRHSVTSLPYDPKSWM